MSVVIKKTEKNSYASRHKIKKDDVLVAINNNEINDFFDYKFYLSQEKITLTLKRSDKFKFITIIKEEYEDIGLLFETYLMDKHKSCKNKCMFCFIDQMPKGLRESLYFKDDDDRLSYLFGNYITLTNLTDKDVARIIKMKISPINISVHTTDDNLRVKMMGNRLAGEKLRYIKELCDNGIKINTQLVLVPGVNDGENLKKSLQNLKSFYPNIESIACVPVGITKHREGLANILPYTKEQAGCVIDILDEFSTIFYKEYQKIIAFASDEFYLIAKRELPDISHYGDFLQLDNGVGMLPLLISEFNEAYDNFEGDFNTSKKISIATGYDAYPFIKNMVDKIVKKWHNIYIEVYKIKNNFFGDNITVAGLICGSDLIEQLENKDLGDTLLLADVMFKSDDNEKLLLDDVTIDVLEQRLKVKIRTIKNDGAELFKAMI